MDSDWKIEKPFSNEKGFSGGCFIHIKWEGI
jgi:hypothetical protein